MRDAGLAVRPEWVIPGGFSLPESRAAMNGCSPGRGPRPTAVFAGSDEMAFGAILAAADHGLAVPDDLSVIGIDDHDYAESFGLTTMAQDPFDQGASATRILLDELAGAEPRGRSVRSPGDADRPSLDGRALPLTGSSGFPDTPLPRRALRGWNNRRAMAVPDRAFRVGTIQRRAVARPAALAAGTGRAAPSSGAALRYGVLCSGSARPAQLASASASTSASCERRLVRRRRPASGGWWPDDDEARSAMRTETAPA